MDAALCNATARAVAVAAFAVMAQASTDISSMCPTSNHAMQNDVETVVETFEGETHIVYRLNVCGSADEKRQTTRLRELEEKLCARNHEWRVKQLLADIAMLSALHTEAWQRRATAARRRAIAKLCCRWKVRRTHQGRSKKLMTIAAELRREFIACGERIEKRSTPFSNSMPRA